MSFGAGIVTYWPYAVLGFAPLFYFDWLQSRARLFDTYYYFTAPWMVANGAFGGFTAWALWRRTAAQPGQLP